MVIDDNLMRLLVGGFPLPIMGKHGLSHWARVLETGHLLADEMGANRDVVTLFAVFHDCRRRSEGRDSGHGTRAADVAMALRPDHIDLSDQDFGLLTTACAHHTDGKTEADITVQCCWDADRLDLGRIGITPNDKLLCTPAARDKMLKRWAFERSQSKFVPSIVEDEWLPLTDRDG
jgi:uncharacterized protein